MSLNLQLRKLHSVRRTGQAISLTLFAKRGGGADPSAAGESKRLACYTDEATAVMLAAVQHALTSARAGRRIWHDSAPDSTRSVQEATVGRGTSTSIGRGEGAAASRQESEAAATHRRTRSGSHARPAGGDGSSPAHRRSQSYPAREPSAESVPTVSSTVESPPATLRLDS